MIYTTVNNNFICIVLLSYVQGALQSFLKLINNSSS